jgi:hypothetical protein
MDRDVAKQIVETAQECMKLLDQTIATVQQKCTAEEFVAYRRTAGHIMGELFIEILEPMYREHRDLEPEYLKKPDLG